MTQVKTTEYSEEDLTPLEYAVLSAHELPIGMAGMVMLQDLIKKGEDASAGARDRTLPLGVRAEALKEAKQVNQTLILLANIQEANGISS